MKALQATFRNGIPVDEKSKQEGEISKCQLQSSILPFGHPSAEGIWKRNSNILFSLLRSAHLFDI